MSRLTNAEEKKTILEWAKIWLDKLVAYENTDLEPAEVEALKAENERLKADAIAEICNKFDINDADVTKENMCIISKAYHVEVVRVAELNARLMTAGKALAEEKKRADVAELALRRARFILCQKDTDINRCDRCNEDKNKCLEAGYSLQLKLAATEIEIERKRNHE